MLWKCGGARPHKPTTEMATQDVLAGAGAERLLRHVSDHADEIDGTIAFAPRGVDPAAIASATSDASGQSGLFDDSFQHCGDPGAQCREFALDDVPDQREVNAEVFVDQLVAHPRDLSPRDQVIACSGFR
jgi:hypothetical protein